MDLAQCDEHGVGPKRRETLVRAGLLARPVQGVLDTEPGERRTIDNDHRRAAWLGLLAYGPETVAVGRSALALLGVQGLPTAAMTEVALPRARSAIPRLGVPLRQYDAGLRCVRFGDRLIAEPRWALAQAVPTLPRWSALSLMDSALHQRLVVDLDDLGVAHDLARRRRGVEKTHRWWELADGRAESPPETWARLSCLDAGSPPDQLQVPVLDRSGILLGRGDLGWRLRDGRWLIGEVDGLSVHERVEALLHDRRRQNELVQHGYDVLRFTPSEARSHQLGRTIRAFLHSRHTP